MREEKIETPKNEKTTPSRYGVPQTVEVSPAIAERGGFQLNYTQSRQGGKEGEAKPQVKPRTTLAIEWDGIESTMMERLILVATEQVPGP